MTHRRLLLVIVIFGLAFAGTANSEVYIWTDRATGARRLSNIAPKWYRNSEPLIGPRVLVTEGNVVVDDTGLAQAEREKLRKNTAASKVPTRVTDIVPKAANVVPPEPQPKAANLVPPEPQPKTANLVPPEPQPKAVNAPILDPLATDKSSKSKVAVPN